MRQKVGGCKYFTLEAKTNFIAGACQCNNHMQSKKIISLGVDVSIDMGQCKTRTKMERECEGFQGWYVVLFCWCFFLVSGAMSTTLTLAAT